MAFNLVGTWHEISEADAAGDPNRLHHAIDNRLAAAAMFGHGVAGVTSLTALAVSERGAGANMSVDVAVGGCVVASTRSVHQGSYPGYNSAVINVAIATSDPTNARIDRILVRVKDKAQDAAFDGIEGMEAVVVQGTPASVPALPTITHEDYIELGRVTVPAAASSIVNANITDVRQSVTTGGVTLTTTALRPGSPATGLVISDTTTGKLHRWSGTAWQDISVGTGMELIETQALTSAAADITFSSIPQTYKSLQLRVRGRAVDAVDSLFLRMQANGDTGANYYGRSQQDLDGTISSINRQGEAYFEIGVVTAGSSTPSAQQGTAIAEIEGYTSGYPMVTARGGAQSSTSHYRGLVHYYGRRNNSAAVTSLRVFASVGNLDTGTTASLYGIR